MKDAGKPIKRTATPKSASIVKGKIRAIFNGFVCFKFIKAFLSQNKSRLVSVFCDYLMVKSLPPKNHNSI